jgi:hypothetical protein
MEWLLIAVVALVVAAAIVWVATTLHERSRHQR